MFGWFSKKTEVQKLIDRVGMDQAVEHYAEIVSRRLPNVGVFRQFLLEELDAAQHPPNTTARCVAPALRSMGPTAGNRRSCVSASNSRTTR